MQQELTTGIRAVTSAISACRFVQSQIDSDALEKRDKSPVTVADFASQALICRELMQAFEDDPIIAEEGADQLRDGDGTYVQRVVEACEASGIDCDAASVCQWIDRGNLEQYRDRFWTIDPIDGTKGFLRGQQYAVALALVIDGRVELGILGCPNLPLDDDQPDGPKGIIAWAVRQQGAWLRPVDQPDAAPQQVRVTTTTQCDQARFCESVESGHSSHSWAAQIAQQLGIHREPYRIDSQCKYVAVARGDADIYLRLPTRPGYQEKIWDHAAGVILVEEAGGRVTDIHGKPPEFHHGSTLAHNRGMVVTNGHLHQQVLKAVQTHAPAEYQA